ncbi:helix-turn-helix domain-containing protein [Mucilaginibacter ginkgonis]|uniref:Helix-turn-helix transcriptional regulator n=1 Tax=Mucilaginibacter ginkgonis TaxID=2682091 RepID=A0A6I4HY22_9SPHI|nr:AraC family transcriptional regulator [Mucilaginibacter ginkgonis]QQL51203.1 helix-turn-helix transcriptional regulator [Mucilaginibacter ginkgonis]
MLPLTLFNSIVEVGAIQGIVMGLVLYRLPVKDPSKKHLSLILFTLALLNFKILLHTLGLWNSHLFHFFPLAIDTTLPPLLYLYICLITAQEIACKKILLYFIPTLIFMAYAILVYVWIIPVTDIRHKDILANKFFFNQIKSLEDFVAVISAVFYWLFGFKRIHNYRKWLFDTQSDSRLQELTWLKNLLIMSAIMILGLITVVLIEDIFTSGPHSFLTIEIFYTYLTLTIYYLSLKGYSLYSFSNPVNLIADKIKLRQFSDITADEYSDDLTLNTEDKAYLTIKESILYSMNVEKIYLNQELNIKQMAQHVGYPVAMVSAVINKSLGVNFRNMVNQYRIKEFKERSINPPMHLSLFGIALECGFNSEPSFFRIFKQETGLSPSDYIKNHKI